MAGFSAAALAAGFLAACSIPGIAPEGRELGLGGEIAAEHDVVRHRAEPWLGRNGYELVSRDRRSWPRSALRRAARS